MEFFNTIDGERRSSGNNHRQTDPRTGEELWPAPISSAQDLDDAASSARRAFRTWGRSTIEGRVEALRQMSLTLMDNKEELMSILMKETGKSVGQTLIGAWELI